VEVSFQQPRETNSSSSNIASSSPHYRPYAHIPRPAPSTLACEAKVPSTRGVRGWTPTVGEPLLQRREDEPVIASAAVEPSRARAAPCLSRRRAPRSGPATISPAGTHTTAGSTPRRSSGWSTYPCPARLPVGCPRAEQSNRTEQQHQQEQQEEEGDGVGQPRRLMPVLPV
jgi:hypothetical protein